MSRNSKIILTTMTMVYREDGAFLVQNRVKKDWPGINFPGGHVEDDESIEESAAREVLEETGLAVSNLENCGYFEWNVPEEGVRHSCVLYRTNDFSGTIRSSKEGEIFWITQQKLDGFHLSTDFDKILDIMLKGL